MSLSTVLRLIAICLVTVVWAIAAILLVPFNRKGRVFHWCASAWGRALLRVASVRLRTRGSEHLRAKSHYIYVANHASYFDIPAMLAGVPHATRIVFKKELTKVPFLGWAIKLGNYIEIDRGDSREALESLEEAARKIREGTSVLLFPEGTRTANGKMQPFKRGAFALAARSRVPIVPVTINGSYAVLPRNSARVTPGDIEIIFHPPLVTNRKSGKEGERELMEEVREVIASRYVEPTQG
jgi:1-acyl-sn-glycerol-3-phosphate acyltransferase